MNGDHDNHELYNCIKALEKENAVLKERLEGHIIHTEKSIEKTEIQLTLRIDALNDSDQQLREQSKQFVDCKLYDANHRLLETKIEERYKTLSTKIEESVKLLTAKIEESVKLLTAKIEESVKLLTAKIAPLEKYIYLGIGGLIIINIAIGVILHFI